MKLFSLLIIFVVIYLIVNNGQPLCGYMAEYPQSLADSAFLPMAGPGNYGAKDDSPYDWAKDAMSGNKY